MFRKNEDNTKVTELISNLVRVEYNDYYVDQVEVDLDDFTNHVFSKYLNDYNFLEEDCDGLFDFVRDICKKMIDDNNESKQKTSTLQKELVTTFVQKSIENMYRNSEKSLLELRTFVQFSVDNRNELIQKMDRIFEDLRTVSNEIKYVFDEK